MKYNMRKEQYVTLLDWPQKEPSMISTLFLTVEFGILTNYDETPSKETISNVKP